MQEGDKCELCNSEPWKTNTEGMGNRNGNRPLPPSKHVRGNPSLAVGVETPSLPPEEAGSRVGPVCRSRIVIQGHDSLSPANPKT